MAAIATPAMARTCSRVLIASADPILRQPVMRSPTYAGALSEEALGGAHALAKLLQVSCDSVVLDRNLPDLDAAEVAEQIRRQFPKISVEFMEAGLENCSLRETSPRRTRDVEVLETRRSLRARMEEISREQVEHESHSTPDGLLGTEPLPEMIGSSRAMAQVYHLVRMVAGRDTAVITGATGTGKELVAGAIHQLSRRARNTLVVVNCAAIPEALLEAELFGHVYGCGAIATRADTGRTGRHVISGRGRRVAAGDAGKTPAISAKLRGPAPGELGRISRGRAGSMRNECATTGSSTGKTVSIGLVLPPRHFYDCHAAATRTPRRYTSTGRTLSGEAVQRW